MSRITQDSIDHLIDSIDIIDLISHYIDVKRSGSNFMAACPFHDDKTPSMSISPAKGLYHCHACGASGNGIRFVMEYERLSFQEALEKIAQFFNVTLEYERGRVRKKSNVLQMLADFYHNKLFMNKEILEYLYSRGLNEESIRSFEIGYSGASYETIRFLEEQKYSYTEACEYGVLTQGNDKAYARFANRITFPIRSGNGAIVGFGGRTLSEEKNIAKYLNSPQSKVFNKSKILYGYYFARQFIYKQKSIIVCEGYLDVIMLHQAGFKNSVATLGTALNEGHLHLLNKDNPRVYMCYDGDSAGINAALKAAKFLSQNNKDGGVVLLQDGLDPADMIVQGRSAEFKTALLDAKPFVEFVLEQIVLHFDITNPMQKQEALKLCLEYLHTLTPLLQDEYRAKCAFLLQIRESYITVKKTKKEEATIKHIPIYNNNFAEESILYNMLMDTNHFFYALNFIDKKHFGMYAEEFSLICQGDRDNDKVNALRFKSEAKILNPEEFQEQLRVFLLKYAQDLLPKLALNTGGNIADTMQKIFTLKDQIKRLQAGEILAI